MTTTPSRAESASANSSQVSGGVESDNVLAPVHVDAARQRDDALKPLGNRLPEPVSLHQSSQTISTVDRSDIDTLSPTGLLDIMGNVPGVSIARAGGIGGQIYLRGFSSNDMRASFFIDGDRFRGRNTLQFMLLSPDEIEQMEIIRGPASSLYGSDALSGVVNAITRSAPPGSANGPFHITGAGASLLWGSNANSTDTHVDLEGAGHGFDFRVDLTGRRADDYTTPEGKVTNSNYRALGGSLKVGYTPSANQRIELTLRDENVNDGRAGGTGGAPGYPYTEVSEDPLRVRMARLLYTRELTGSWFDYVEASAYVNDFYTTINTISNTYANNVLQKTTNSNSYVIGPVVAGGRMLGTIPWRGSQWGTAKTTLGADYFNEQRPGSESDSSTVKYNAAGAVTGTTTLPRAQNNPNTSQMDLGAFILHEWTPVPRLTLSASGRFDWIYTHSDLAPLPSPQLLPAFAAQSSTTRTAPTGGLGIVYRLLPTLDLIANAGTSYHQATNGELYTASVQGNGFLLPNPNLKPERGTNIEAGFRSQTSAAELTVTGFHSQYRDLIVTESGIAFDGTSSSQKQNISHAEIDGLEAEGRWQFTESFNLFGNLTALRGTNTDTNRPLPYIAPLLGRVGLQYTRPAGMAFIAAMDWGIAKSRIDPTQEYTTPGFTVFNLYGRFDLGRLVSGSLRNTTLTLGAENLFNAVHVSPSTYSNMTYGRSLTNPLLEPGRNLTVKLEYRL